MASAAFKLQLLSIAAVVLDAQVLQVTVVKGNYIPRNGQIRFVNQEALIQDEVDGRAASAVEFWTFERVALRRLPSFIKKRCFAFPRCAYVVFVEREGIENNADF